VAESGLYCSIVLWNLSHSEQTVASLRAYLRDYAVDAYSQAPGLRQKVWISSTGPDGETWGAVYLWDNKEAAYGRPPIPSRVVELIGYLPTSRQYFGVEAATEGVSEVGALVAGLGMAYQQPDAEPLTRPAEYASGATSIIPFAAVEIAATEPSAKA
jgi:hypothetical protein